jgi:methylmalonyl-CoA mutase N-terminal domain/subunit
VESGARKLIDRVEEMGGAVAAIEAGFQRQEIESAAYRTAKAVEDGSRVVVGVNRYRVPADELYEPLRVDPRIEAEQVRRLELVRAGRDDRATRRSLDELRRVAEGDDNVLYPLREALRLRATIGEVCNALREVWGVYRPSSSF